MCFLLYVCMWAEFYLRYKKEEAHNQPCYYCYFPLLSPQGPHGRHHFRWHGIGRQQRQVCICCKADDGIGNDTWKLVTNSTIYTTSFTAFNATLLYVVYVYVTVVYVSAYELYELWFVCKITVQVTYCITDGNFVFICVLILPYLYLVSTQSSAFMI